MLGPFPAESQMERPREPVSPALRRCDRGAAARGPVSLSLRRCAGGSGGRFHQPVAAAPEASASAALMAAPESAANLFCSARTRG